MQDPHFDHVRRFGTRVHCVEGLDEEVIYCPVSDVAFIRAELDEESRRSTSAWVFGEAVAARSLRLR